MQKIYLKKSLLWKSQNVHKSPICSWVLCHHWFIWLWLCPLPHPCFCLMGNFIDLLKKHNSTNFISCFVFYSKCLTFCFDLHKISLKTSCSSWMSTIAIGVINVMTLSRNIANNCFYNGRLFLCNLLALNDDIIISQKGQPSMPLPLWLQDSTPWTSFHFAIFS